jgi:hypothetical protein
MLVTQYGKELDKSKYNWDKENKVFSTSEDNLVLDFSDYNGVTFKTSYSCTFTTGSNCTFNTGAYCTFNTDYSCTFNTDNYCTFDTGSYCIFKTGSECTFKTGDYCTFKTGSSCTFTTSSDCTFNTDDSCTFKTGENCFVTRYDVKGVTEIPQNKTIKLNGCKISGYTEIKEKLVVIKEDGNVIEFEGKKYKLVSV